MSKQRIIWKAKITEISEIAEIAEIEQRISLANKSCSREAVSSYLSDKKMMTMKHDLISLENNIIAM